MLIKSSALGASFLSNTLFILQFQFSIENVLKRDMYMDVYGYRIK